MIEPDNLETLFRKHDCTEFRWIKTAEVVIAHWVRMKCLFGCDDYGDRAVCPPNLPPVSECEQFFREYEQAVVFRFHRTLDDPAQRFDWTREINQRLLSLERDVFLAGHHKAFVMFVDPCNICASCADTAPLCRNPKLARPSPEGMGVDVFALARSVGFPIEVLADYGQAMNRYGLLLTE